MLELEGLVDAFLQDKFLENESVLPKLDEIRKKLEDSNIPKSKQHRLKMLIDDIANNRYRVTSILRRLNNSEDDIKNILKVLAREKLLSDEQYKKLANSADLDLPAVALVIKDTKIGRGLKFLPRKMNELVTNLQTLLTELVETGSSAIRRDVGSILDELLQRKGITQDRYKSIKEENDIE